MSGIQTKNGKAFEYACLKALQDVLSLNQVINVRDDAAYHTAKSSYEKLSQSDRDNMYIGAFSAVNKLCALEPMLENGCLGNTLDLKIQTDDNGKRGDVRDVLCIRNGDLWEIGISCKHNHHAVKHSRLSSTIDFGKEWMGVHCSERYFAKIRPIFDDLENTRLEARKQNTIAKWSELLNKEDDVYVPILNAFLEELRRIANEDEHAAKKFTSYLIGTKDFYKVIMDEKNEATRIEAMNISGTLNRKSGNIKARIGVPKLKMPTKFLEMRFKRNSKTTIEILLDEGWSFSMRIHSAKEELEASLKFDINLIGCPSNNYAQTELWYSNEVRSTGT